MGLRPLNLAVEDRSQSTFADATHFARAARAVDSLLAAVTPDLWSAPTPCSDWDLAQLTEHLIDVNHSFAAQLAGTTLVYEKPEDSPVARYRTSSLSLQRALTAAGSSTRLRSRLALRVADLLVHGWDIATATGQPARMPDDVTEDALMFFQRRAGVLRRSGQFAEPQPVDDHAAALEKLAALSGRTIQREGTSRDSSHPVVATTASSTPPGSAQERPPGIAGRRRADDANAQPLHDDALGLADAVTRRHDTDDRS